MPARPAATTVNQPVATTSQSVRRRPGPSGLSMQFGNRPVAPHLEAQAAMGTADFQGEPQPPRRTPLMSNEVKRILLVEDNDLSRDALARRLTRSGYAVQAAADGRQALQMAQRIEPDLILMDLGL